MLKYNGRKTLLTFLVLVILLGMYWLIVFKYTVPFTSVQSFVLAESNSGLFNYYILQASIYSILFILANLNIYGDTDVISLIRYGYVAYYKRINRNILKSAILFSVAFYGVDAIMLLFTVKFDLLGSSALIFALVIRPILAVWAYLMVGQLFFAIRQLSSNVTLNFFILILILVVTTKFSNNIHLLHPILNISTIDMIAMGNFTVPYLLVAIVQVLLINYLLHFLNVKLLARADCL